MVKRIRKSSRSASEYAGGSVGGSSGGSSGGAPGGHRFEHWYVDNQVYFITARCRDRFSAFAAERAKAVFWGRFSHSTNEAGFEPWVTSLLDNHYHTLGYCRRGLALKTMMQRLHGSVAKLVNDVLEEAGRAGNKRGAGGGRRLVPFWRETKGREYFDGCIRDEKQTRLAYRYTLTQSQRHGLCADWRDYPHTRVAVGIEQAIRRAHELRAFMEGVRYRRYER